MTNFCVLSVKRQCSRVIALIHEWYLEPKILLRHIIKEAAWTRDRLEGVKLGLIFLRFKWHIAASLSKSRMLKRQAKSRAVYYQLPKSRIFVLKAPDGKL